MIKNRFLKPYSILVKLNRKLLSEPLLLHNGTNTKALSFYNTLRTLFRCKLVLLQYRLSSNNIYAISKVKGIKGNKHHYYLRK